MNDEQSRAHSDTLREPLGDPDLARVRRRGESHMLALISAAAVILIAVAIAKPWGQSAPPAASAPTGSTPAELARTSPESAPPPASAATPSAQPATGLETSPPFLIVLLPVADPSASPGFDCAYYQVTGTITGTEIEIAADPSNTPVFFSEPASALSDGA